MQKSLVMALIVLFCSLPAMAREVAGIHMEDEVTQEDGTVLLLNGVGVRSKFFYKNYAAGLYLESKSSTTEEILAQDEGKRVVMHFLY
ncbi:MAG: chalcone isomerase family protein, partial [Desulfofustis sp.]|nr:chalcone isomerase family protein [Desulfofustis sp.]